MKKASYPLNVWSNEILMHLTQEHNSDAVRNRDFIANLTSWLSTTPRYTVYRVNTLSHNGKEIIDIINSQLAKQVSEHEKKIPSVFIHPQMSEAVVVSSWEVNSLNLNFQNKEVIVDLACGIAVLRGAHVFAPGVKGMSSDIAPGDSVSVYADIENKCTRGLTTLFRESKYFVGNGRVKIGRNDLFGGNLPVKGIAVEMTDIQSGVPSLPFNCVPDSYALLQNLPSILSCRTLDPKPGEKILDMCAAPGNKTTHLAMLMNDRGSIIAIDKTANKVKAINDRCQQFNISCVKSFVFDSTKAVFERKKSEREITISSEASSFKEVVESEIHCLDDKPPFFCESFDRILLDAPCSALGQRPCIYNATTLKQLKSYPSLQKKLFQVAVTLLKTGGHLVYSTCTVTVSENELLVKWALDKFPCLVLVPIEPALGGDGLGNTGLSKQQQKCVRRFGPPFNSVKTYVNNYDYNQDTIGFFIAHFVKV